MRVPHYTNVYAYASNGARSMQFNVWLLSDHKLTSYTTFDQSVTFMLPQPSETSGFNIFIYLSGVGGGVCRGETVWYLTYYG